MKDKGTGVGIPRFSGAHICSLPFLVLLEVDFENPFVPEIDLQVLTP
jgi:hypothetical protein